MPEEKSLLVDGKWLEIAWCNPAASQKVTLVCLHEGLGCTAMWRDFPAKVATATGCRAFIFSRFGYGRSDTCRLPRPIRFMHDEGLRVLPEVLKAAKINEYILIGHSDGGSIALIHAGGGPFTGLRGVITEAAHVCCEPLTTQSIQQAKTLFIKGDLRKRLEKYHGTNTDTAFWGWNDVWLDPEFVYWNIESCLPRIRVPVLALQGEDDHYGTSAQIAAIAKQAGGGAELVMLSDCGHAPHQDRPGATLAAMTTFIGRVLGNKRS